MNCLPQGKPTTAVPPYCGMETGFVAYAHAYIGKMQEEGRYDAAYKLCRNINRFVAFLGRKEIPFNEFDLTLMRDYHDWLKGKGLGRNSISLYIRNLKRVYQQAVAGGITTERHPFAGMDVSYRTKKDRKGLTLEEVKSLRGLDLSRHTPSVAFARDIFLFSVYTHGMTANDIFRLTPANIRNGMLVYTRNATGKTTTLPWKPAMQDIVDRHARPGTPHLFPVLTAEDAHAQWQQHCTALHNINRNLKPRGRLLQLPVPLTMTVAHHSWESMTQGVSMT